MQSILTAVPDNHDLLVAVAAEFVHHGRECLAQASAGAAITTSEATEKLHQAKAMFLQARAYGIRALVGNQQGLPERASRDWQNALRHFAVAQAPALYWTGLAMTAAVYTDRHDRILRAELPLAKQLLQKAGELDASFKRPLPGYVSMEHSKSQSNPEQHVTEPPVPSDSSPAVGGTQ